MYVKYDPMGNRVWRKSNFPGFVAEANHIVDISGPLPVILCELDDTGEMTNSYIWADGQILAKCDHQIKEAAFVRRCFF